MSESRAISSICVAGGGIVGLSAALAFARALPGVRVTIIETPVDPGALADRMTGTLPAVHRFHAAIGLDEMELVRAGIATHLLGHRFEGWSADGGAWYESFGEHGLPVGGAPFHSVWQRAREASKALPFHRYAAPAVLAEAGKFVHPSPDPRSPFGTFLYGLRLDPLLYRERLASAAAALPTRRGDIGRIERRPDGGIASLRLKDGSAIEADLFIDATGPSASLLARLEPSFESWSELPCLHLSFSEEPSPGPQPADDVTATQSGWRLRSALADRSLVVNASGAAGSADGNGEGIVIRPGCRPHPWVRNVLALGDAAIAVDPLHAINLHLAQAAILRALELLPGRDMHPLELKEYNRRTRLETDRVRDFIALHYLRSGRAEPFWSDLAKGEAPSGLERTLAQFVRRGRLPFFEEETFDKDSWLAALLGLGVVPEHVDAAASAVDPERAFPAMEKFAANLQTTASGAPSYRDYLARMMSGRR